MSPVSIQVYAGGGLQAWPVLVAKQQGFFQKNGVNANVVQVNTGPQALAALTSGQLDMVQIDVIQAAPLMAQGKSLGIVMGNNSLDFSLVARKGLNITGTTYPSDVAALKGQTVGVLALGGVLQDLAVVALKGAGLTSTSVRWTAISAGGLAADVAALQAKQIDALMTQANDNILFQSLGDQVLVDFSKHTPDAAGTPELAALQGITDGGIWATQGWMSSHSAALAGTRMALMQADVWMHDPKNLPAVVSLVKSQGGIPAQLPPSDVNTFVQNSLSMTHASYASSSAQEEMSFATQFGLVKSAIPLAQYFGSGIPSTEAAVQAAVGSSGS